MRKCGIRAASIHQSLDILLYSISISMHKHKYGSLCSNSLYLGSSSRALDSMSNAIKATADRSISPFNINHRFKFCNCPSVMCSRFNPMKLLLAHLKNALLDHFSNRFCRRLTHEKWMLLENEIDCKFFRFPLPFTHFLCSVFRGAWVSIFLCFFLLYILPTLSYFHRLGMSLMVFIIRFLLSGISNRILPPARKQSNVNEILGHIILPCSRAHMNRFPHF